MSDTARDRANDMRDRFIEKWGAGEPPEGLRAAWQRDLETVRWLSGLSDKPEPDNRGLDEPISDALRKHAQADGYTELHFNPKTMGWAWHRPDQVVGEDGRIYMRARGI